MKEKVYSYCKLDDAKGQKPITLRWVDTNKGDLLNPVVRSRLCVREQKRGRNAVQALEPEHLFSAMPIGVFQIVGLVEVEHESFEA